MRTPSTAPRTLAAALLGLLVLAPPARAAMLGGTVTSDGAPVAGAFVAVTGAGANKHTAVTDETGAWAVEVTNDTYELAVQAAGHRVGEAEAQVTGADVTQDVTLVGSGTKFKALGVFGGQISAIVADGTSGVFYAATTVIPQLFRTTDHGGHWTPVTLAADDPDVGLSGSSNIMGGRHVTASGYPGEIAVVVAGAAYYSRDFGATWEKVGGTVGPNDELHWAHDAADATNVLLAVSGSGTQRADMSAAEPAFAAMTNGLLGGGGDRMHVATGTDGAYAAVVDGGGSLAIYRLDATDDPFATVGAALGGFPSPPTFVRLGGAKAAGVPPDAVLVFSSGANAAMMATKSSGAAAFTAGDRSAATALVGCGTQPGSIGSVAPLSTGTSGTGTVSQCLIEKTGTGALAVTMIPGINNNTGLAFDAGYDGGANQVMISGDGNRGLVKSARSVTGTPEFPSMQDATAGTDPTSGGIAVEGFDVAVVKDTTFGPAGASQLATALSMSGGGLGVASDDGGATFVTAVRKGGNAVGWWDGISGEWLVFGHTGAGNLLSARLDWTSADAALPAPNVAGTDGTALGASASPHQYAVTAVRGAPGTDTVFVGGGVDIDQVGTSGGLVRAGLTPGSPNPTIGDVTAVDGGVLPAAVRALAYCGADGSDASVADVLLAATATGSGGTPTGGLVRVTDATTATPVATAVASLAGTPVNDVRVDCGSGTVYAGAGSNSGGPSGALWKSTDGGATFTTVPVTAPGLPGNLNVQVVALNPADPNEVLIAGNSEGFIVRSTDGGTTWTLVNAPNAPGGRSFLSEGVGDLEIPHASPALVAGLRAAPVVSSGEALVGTGGGLFAASVRGETTGGGGDCTTAAQCDDGDACTTDACTAGSCTSTQQTGTAGVLCELDGLGDMCAPGAIDAKTSTMLTKMGNKARGLVQKAAAATKPKKAAKLRKKAAKQLTALRKKVTKAKDLAADCGSALTQQIQAIQDLLAAGAG